MKRSLSSAREISLKCAYPVLIDARLYACYDSVRLSHVRNAMPPTPRNPRAPSPSIIVAIVLVLLGCAILIRTFGPRVQSALGVRPTPPVVSTLTPISPTVPGQLTRSPVVILVTATMPGSVLPSPTLVAPSPTVPEPPPTQPTLSQAPSLTPTAALASTVTLEPPTLSVPVLPPTPSMAPTIPAATAVPTTMPASSPTQTSSAAPTATATATAGATLTWTPTPTSESAPDDETDTPVPEPTPPRRQITYRVDGSASTVSIVFLYNDRNVIVDEATLPWSMSLEVASDASVQVTADNLGETGALRCIIEMSGSTDPIAEHTGTTSVNCEATLP